MLNEQKNVDILYSDEELINTLKQIEKIGSSLDISKICNKLWKCFLNNDGSMTFMLKSLFEDNLKMNLLSSKLIDLNKDDSIKECIKLINSILKVNTNFKKIIERKIIFKDGINGILYAVSYWDSDIYNMIYKDVEDNKPIGIVMREKEIEYFKTIKNFILQENKIIFRFSVYKIKNIIAFILIEVINSKSFEQFFDILK